MGFAISRPQVLWAILLVIPAVIYSSIKYSRLVRTIGMNKVYGQSNAKYNRFRKGFVSRTLFRAVAWIMVVLAMAGISWGTNSVPVQKSGDAVCMVFDISYSMEAKDAPGGMSRLSSAVNYAEQLLEHLEGASVSCVIAKGDGTVAIPLTEDYMAVTSLLESLSPELMTAEGTSLGSGINCAINSFPQQSSQAQRIWLFTDGEETDNSLSAALSNAFKYGIPVSIIGFGSERESTVLAGDGKTTVKTALRSDNIRKIIEQTRKKNSRLGQNHSDVDIVYVDASEVGSALQLLQFLHKNTASGEESHSVAYEIQSVPRHNVFIVLAILCFVASFILSEFDPDGFKKSKGVAAAGIVFAAFMFTGCNSSFKAGTEILQGKFEWNRKNYPAAATSFLNAQADAQKAGDLQTEQYAIYGLASTYMMQDESEAALERFSQISDDAPSSVRFAVMYNCGIIAHRKGDFAKATECFKNALLIDSTSTDAKINLELSLQQKAIQAKSQQQALSQVSEDKDQQSLEQALYTIIQENDQNKWKNEQQTKPQASSSRDF